LKDTEVEIQVEIENIKPLVDLMEKSGKLLFSEHQIDHYYTPAHRNFAELEPINEWLRLRNSDGKYSITYKNWHRDESKKAHHCDEYETTLGEINQVEKIFDVLNFTIVVIVDKKRKAYLYKDYEIALDQVKNLGNFVEIEYKGDKVRDPDEIAKEMKRFLKNLGLGRIAINSVGYAYKLLKPDSDHLEEEL
jgi:adenylate cyclase class 2